jgi:hypothetical protein
LMRVLRLTQAQPAAAAAAVGSGKAITSTEAAAASTAGAGVSGGGGVQGLLGRLSGLNPAVRERAQKQLRRELQGEWIKRVCVGGHGLCVGCHICQ